jgi:hypothetical protein
VRVKLSVWSDYGARAQKHSLSASMRGTRTSIGPMILLAAVVVVAGVIGVSGIYPQIIDAGWVPDTSTRPPKMFLSNPQATRRRSHIVAAIPLGAVTTGEAAVLPGDAPASELSPVAGLEPLEKIADPLAVAAIPYAQGKAEAKAADTASAKPAKKPRVVKKRVVRVQHHQRGDPGTYTPYGGGWDGRAGGDWSGLQAGR